MSAAKILKEIAEDYRTLAKDPNGNVDRRRQERYEWLLKVAEIMARTPASPTNPK
jgi:hypothetical protein